MLVPGALTGGGKYAHDGELFARLQLKESLSEDSAGGRLIMNSQVAWLSLVTTTPVPPGELRKVCNLTHLSLNNRMLINYKVESESKLAKFLPFILDFFNFFFKELDVFSTDSINSFLCLIFL